MWVSDLFCVLLAATLGHGYYHPDLGDRFQIQLNVGTHDPFDYSHYADLFDTDMWALTRDQIHTIHSRGSKVVCYFSAGTLDPNRPDAGQFHGSDLGNKMQHWDETWLNIKSHNVMAIMSRRFDYAKNKGCDAIDTDNVDSWQSSTSGFHYDRDDQIEYNKWLARQAHSRDMAIGLKNCGSLVHDLVDDFDFVIDENCHEYDGQCMKYQPFMDRDKPVFNIEYTTSEHVSHHDLAKCTSSQNPHYLQTQFKMKLNAWVYRCPGQ